MSVLVSKTKVWMGVLRPIQYFFGFLEFFKFVSGRLACSRDRSARYDDKVAFCHAISFVWMPSGVGASVSFLASSSLQFSHVIPGERGVS